MPEELISYLVNLLCNSKYYRRKENRILLEVNDEVLNGMSVLDFKEAMSALNNNFKAFKNVSSTVNPHFGEAPPFDQHGHYDIVVNPKVFDDFLVKKYKTEVFIDNTPVAWITYKKWKGEILLNDVFLLSEPHYDSPNYRFMEYVYNNPNIKINSKKLKKFMYESKEVSSRSFHNILQDLGFKGDLKLIFFKVSNKTIQINNLVTKNILKEIGIEKIKILTK